ncbi:hypothetical protein [Zobellella sp. An-6]|uniref:hypothetical protein n=1 Tax=Zobellella sp. An-6 TaxID=3400218 RepID=UPI004041C8A0
MATTLVEWIEDWSNGRQGQLLAELAAISRSRRGWILMLNTPAPLSPRALATTGVDPALVVDMGKGVLQPLGLVHRAIAHKGIAAVVCWQCRPVAGQRQSLEQAAQRHRNRVFLIAPTNEMPALH